MSTPITITLDADDPRDRRILREILMSRDIAEAAPAPTPAPKRKASRPAPVPAKLSETDTAAGVELARKLNIPVVRRVS